MDRDRSGYCNRVSTLLQYPMVINRIIREDSMRHKRVRANFIFIKAEINKDERNLLKAKAAIKGISTQNLVGSLIREYINR
jgi:hypothetical protein